MTMATTAASWSSAHAPVSLQPEAQRATPMMNPSDDNGVMNNQNNAAPLSKPSLPAPQRNWSNMTRTIAHYERIEQIGEGTYGQVYRARCKDTNQIVALKKIRVHHGDYWGMPPTVIREIKILKRLRHQNLVQMVEVVSSKGVEHLDEEDEVMEKHKISKKDRIVDAREGYKGNLFLVLEYVSHDLTGLMDVAYRFSEVQVKCIFKQLLEALQYMHDNKYVHRDIKSSNILIDHNYRVKLADFGLARCIEPPILDKIHDRGNSQEFTNKVITLWYRPPELLLGATRYGPPVDIWSAGCILAELILGKPLFTGKSEMDQLQLIFDMLGTPTPETWDGFQDLKLLRTGEVTIENKRKAKLREKYHSKISAPALNLVEKLLELDPQKRLTASRALNSRYFLSDPRPPDRPEELGTLLVEGGHFHEFQTKKKRREAKHVAEKARQTALDGGRSEKEAQEEFDATYRGIMEKVAKEGLQAGPKVDKKDLVAAKSKSTAEEKSKRDKTERKRTSRDKERKKSHREERRREGKDKEKERSHRKRSDSEDKRGEEEKRRKRRREEEDNRGDLNTDNERKGEKNRGGDHIARREVQEESTNGRAEEAAMAEAPLEHAEDLRGKFGPPAGDSKAPLDEEDGDRRSRSSRRRRERSRSVERSREQRVREKRRGHSRDDGFRGRRDEPHDTERDRDRERLRRGEERDRDRERKRDRSSRDLDRGRGNRDRDHRQAPGSDFGRRDDFGPRGGPNGRQGGDGPPPDFRGGPPADYRGGPPPPEHGIYGPASGPPPGQGPPIGYYDGPRRRESPHRRDRR